MSVSKSDLKHIAKLAKLEFSDEELDSFGNEFNSILDYVSKINECDVSGIDFEHNLQNYSGEVLQQDAVKTSPATVLMLHNATEGRTKNGYIRTSKIVNKE
jgi:aspartyl-tRNA(Asn)/glutamyl-tRNA(Gln) amidotransferase subunit C